MLVSSSVGDEWSKYQFRNTEEEWCVDDRPPSRSSMSEVRGDETLSRASYEVHGDEVRGRRQTVYDG